MTREDAVATIISVWQQADSYMCCSQADADESRAEMLACLTALGITEEEMA